MDAFFKYLNILPMPVWIGMMFAPDHRLTERASRSSTVFIIAALNYLVALLLSIRGTRRNGEQIPLDFTSLEGVRKGLGTREGTTGAWAHMLALDLFVGAWIYRQARALNAPAPIRVVSILFAMMAGPVGLLIFLLWRIFGAGRPEQL